MSNTATRLTWAESLALEIQIAEDLASTIKQWGQNIRATTTYGADHYTPAEVDTFDSLAAGKAMEELARAEEWVAELKDTLAAQ